MKDDKKKKAEIAEIEEHITRRMNYRKKQLETTLLKLHEEKRKIQLKNENDATEKIIDLDFWINMLQDDLDNHVYVVTVDKK